MKFFISWFFWLLYLVVSFEGRFGANGFLPMLIWNNSQVTDTVPHCTYDWSRKKIIFPTGNEPSNHTHKWFTFISIPRPRSHVLHKVYSHIRQSGPSFRSQHKLQTFTPRDCQRDEQVLEIFTEIPHLYCSQWWYPEYYISFWNLLVWHDADYVTDVEIHCTVHGISYDWMRKSVRFLAWWLQLVWVFYWCYFCCWREELL